MKYLEFTLQTILFIGTLLCTILSLYNYNWVDEAFICFLSLGTWQFVSSLIATAAQTPGWKKKRIHLAASSIYLTFLLTSMKMPWPQTSFTTCLLVALVTIPPLALCAYYYVITIFACFYQKKRSKFLPNLGF